MESSNWLPLESNPDVINEYAKGIGFDSSALTFQDVLGMEPWAVEMLGQPVLAYLLTYEVTAPQKEHKKKEAQLLAEKPQTLSPSLFYMKQYAGNACGTIALLHALAPLYQTRKELFAPGSVLVKIYDDAKGKTPEAIGEALVANAELKSSHSVAVSAGDTEVSERCNNHFVCITYHDGGVYELDGRKKFPVKHSECKEADFGIEGLKVLKSYVDRDPSNPHFNIIGLAKAAEF